MRLGNIDLMKKLSLKVRVRIITVGSAQSGMALATFVALECLQRPSLGVAFILVIFGLCRSGRLGLGRHRLFLVAVRLNGHGEIELLPRVLE